MTALLALMLCAVVDAAFTTSFGLFVQVDGLQVDRVFP